MKLINLILSVSALTLLPFNSYANRYSYTRMKMWCGINITQQSIGVRETTIASRNWEQGYWYIHISGSHTTDTYLTSRCSGLNCNLQSFFATWDIPNNNATEVFPIASLTTAHTHSFVDGTIPVINVRTLTAGAHATPMDAMFSSYSLDVLDLSRAREIMQALQVSTPDFRLQPPVFESEIGLTGSIRLTSSSRTQGDLISDTYQIHYAPSVLNGLSYHINRWCGTVIP